MFYSEKPVATLKALFRYLYEIAAWHRPTVLIFDNLDKVLRAEVEVSGFRNLIYLYVNDQIWAPSTPTRFAIAISRSFSSLNTLQEHA